MELNCQLCTLAASQRNNSSCYPLNRRKEDWAPSSVWSGPRVLFGRFEEDVIKSRSLPGFKPQLLNHWSSKGLTQVPNVTRGFLLCAVGAKFERNSVFRGLKKDERR
jgi:hypothetical protein